MVGSSSLVTFDATLILAAPAIATPIGEPARISSGANSDVLFNRADGIYLAVTTPSDASVPGYTGQAVPRSGPVPAVPVFGETGEPPASLAVVQDTTRNEYLAL